MFLELLGYLMTVAIIAGLVLPFVMAGKHGQNDADS